MDSHKRWIFLGAAGATTIALGSAGATGVSAASGTGSSGLAHSQHRASIVPLRGGVPFDQVFTNMDYNGGPVMPSSPD
jgi:hypothetical protein